MEGVAKDYCRWMWLLFKSEAIVVRLVCLFVEAIIDPYSLHSQLFDAANEMSRADDDDGFYRYVILSH